MPDQQKGHKMNKRFKVIGVLTSATLIGSMSVASADSKSDYKAAIESWKANTKAAQSNYKSAVESYKASKKSFAASKKSIVEKFKADATALKIGRAHV